MNTLKDIMKWVLIPFTVLIGALLYVINKLNSANRSLAQRDAAGKLELTLAKKEEAKKDAEQAIEEWEKVRHNYFNDDGTPKL